jgi:hypothetical protein
MYLIVHFVQFDSLLRLAHYKNEYQQLHTLSEQTTHNGPLMTRILNDILEKDVIFKSYASTITIVRRLF